MSELAAKVRSGEDLSRDNKPVILFATPELVVSDSFLVSLGILYRARKLHQIVIDEFDYIAESTENFRKDYKKLPKFRLLCPQVPFLVCWKLFCL